MAEYINREAVLDKRRKVTEYDEAAFAMSYQAVPVEDIEAIPAADVVEVVRCEKCKNFVANSQGTWCRKQSCIHTAHRFPNDFCSYGDRKGGESE